MKKKLVAVLVAIAACCVIPAAAQASPIIECGNYAPTGNWQGYWTYGTVYGATPVANLTTRKVRCSDARRFSLRVTGGGHRRYHGFVCRWHTLGVESYDARCTRGVQVIHWQGGA